MVYIALYWSNLTSTAITASQGCMYIATDRFQQPFYYNSKNEFCTTTEPYQYTIVDQKRQAVMKRATMHVSAPSS